MVKHRLKHQKTTGNAGFLVVLFEQGKKDSNPQQRFWRPTCCHYTIPLRNGVIITRFGEVVNA